jgi:ATP-dependent helicase/nuclease subunit A
MNKIPVKPADAQWTDEQWKAIWAKGQDILVSAAAGSGKTAVLIERLIQKILASEEERINVDELLVVTFTNASAAEMRNRMAEALEKAIANDSENEFLRLQLNLINKAQISTLHSFCLSICREYAYLIDLDPGFRLASPDEAALLQDDVLMEVLEKAYSGELQEFTQEEMYKLVDAFSSDRNDQAIEKILQKMYETSRVQPDPYVWLKQLPLSYDVNPEASMEQTAIGQDVKPSVILALKEAEEALRLATQYAEVTTLAKLEANKEIMAKDYAEVRAIREVFEHSWADAYPLLQKKTWDRAKNTTKKDDPEQHQIYQKMKELRDNAKDVLADLQKTYFARAPHLFLQEMADTKPLIETLVKLTIVFSEAFKTEKLKQGMLDFSDLEHFALEILTEPGTLNPSDVALSYKKRFKEVLVDEYQDTNVLQETILQLVKNGDAANGNMFMVGDVKQSIYAFRLAAPKLFLEKYKTFEENPTNTGMKIDLNANFRSREEVLHGTNYIFEKIMDEEVGEIKYDEQAKLKPRASYNEMTVPVELVLLEGNGSKVEERLDETSLDAEDEDESIDAAQQEARYIISRIRQMVEGKEQVYNPKTKSMRDISYRDIVVLMRSRTWYTTFAEEFKQAGLPLYAETDGGYFESIEVMTMLNTLKIIDNPYQDIPLVSVLRAPFIGLTETELAAIRLLHKNEPELVRKNARFFDLVSMYKESSLAEETKRKLDHFMTHFNEWRNFSRHGSLADLIWKVYSDTNYYEMVGAMGNGKQRQANLRALHDRALSYEKSSFRGLFRFLRFIDRMHSRGDDLGIAKSIGEADDVVTLITIHKSKGLEFPVVFVAGMDRSFNNMDLRSRYMFDESFGIAVNAVNTELNFMTKSLATLYVTDKKRAKMKAEEMRILYVAMTRAKERLILVGSIQDYEKTKEAWARFEDITRGHVLPSYIRSKANSYLSWVGPAVAGHEEYAFVMKGLDHDDAQTKEWKIRVVSNEAFKQRLLKEEEQSIADSENVDDQFYQELVRRFEHSYAYEPAITMKSKTSVSELKRMQALEELEQNPYTTTSSIFLTTPKPSFLREEKKRPLSAAQIGTAVHVVMQHAPLTGLRTIEETNAYLQVLVEKQLLSDDEAKAIDVTKVVAFFQSAIGKRLMNATHVLKEVPFTLSIQTTLGDAQIIQGVIDCMFEEQDGQWVLLDYKTDKILSHFAEGAPLQKEMTNRYSTQLQYYTMAIESIKRVKVKEKVLYLYDIGQELTIEE